MPNQNEQADDLNTILNLEERRSRWPRRLLILAAVGIAVGAAGWYFRPQSKSASAERFRTAEATRGDLEVIVSATGTLKPVNQVDVGTEVSGTIRSVEADYNDPVKEGQILARLDTTRLEAQKAQAAAALAAARAELQSARAGAAEADLTLERFQKAFQESGGRLPSRQELDAARTTADKTKAQVAMAQANITKAEASLEAYDSDLNKAIIRSPIDGLVLDRQVDVGQTVAASLQAPVLLTLAETLTGMSLSVAVDEADVGRVRQGQRATFVVDAYPKKRFPARITQVRFAPKTEAGVVTYECLLEVDNSDLLLRPGMTATAYIVTAEVRDVILVPNAALRFTPVGRIETETADPAPRQSLISRIMPGPRRFSRPRTRNGPAETESETVRIWLLEDGTGDHRPGTGLQMTGLVIEFKSVHKVYGRGPVRVPALLDVNLAVNEGEFVAIMGPSGSGKSTAMNILGCLDTPTSGDYLFKGVSVGSLSRNQLALLRRHYLGFVFQGFNLLNRTTALENVELPLIYRGTGRWERRREALRALDLVGLADRAGHSPVELSGGQQQRVAIARALVSRPAVLLADEPTGNLDSARSREIMQLIRSLNRELGLCVMMVTHEKEMAAYAHRIIRFLDGCIETDGHDKEAA